MTFNPADYPTLQALFRGYLHEDYAVEHGTAAAAVAAFRADASSRERSALDNEWDEFAALTRSWPWPDVQIAIVQLGAAWQPRDRAALTAALAHGERGRR